MEKQQNPHIPQTPMSMGKDAFKNAFKKVRKEAVDNGKNPISEYNPALLSDLKHIISKYTETPELLETINGQTNENFIEKLNIDSIDFVEIIVDTEEKFGITMQDEEIHGLSDFDDLYLLIDSKINNKTTE
jgi:acyl carrier protein